MPGYDFTIGPLIGIATYTGPTAEVSSLTITLTDDILPTDPTNSRGIVIAIATSEASATAPTSLLVLAQNLLRQQVAVTATNPPLVNFSNPYTTRTAYEMFYGGNRGTHIGHTFVGSGGTTHMFQGLFGVRFFHGLEAGSTITVTMGVSSNGRPIDWWKAQVYRATDINPSNESPAMITSSGWGGLHLGGTGSPNSNQVIVGVSSWSYWDQFVMTSVTTLNTTMTITRSLPGVFSDTYLDIIERSGVFRSLFSGYQMGVTHSTASLTLTRSAASGADWTIGKFGHFPEIVNGIAYNSDRTLSLNYHH